MRFQELVKGHEEYIPHIGSKNKGLTMTHNGAYTTNNHILSQKSSSSWKKKISEREVNEPTNRIINQPHRRTGMLYNPTWKKKTADNISLSDFIGWLETKDPTETFDYKDRCGRCCVGQYMADRGVAWPSLGSIWGPVYQRTCAKIFDMPSDRVQTLLEGGFGYKPQPFGAVLERVKDFQKKQENA